jgi:hypothetical protein
LGSELAAALAALALLTWAGRADAGGPVGENGTAITTSNYALDLFHGPVFAGSRVTGLAGSYVAIAEDVDGDLQNPAAPAVRPFFSYSYFDYWIGLGLTFPTSLKDTDFFNSGSKTNIVNSPDSFVFFTPALNLQWGEFGVGVNVETQHYALSAPSTAESSSSSISATIPTTHLQIAHGFAHNQIVVGVGARLVSMSVSESRGDQALFTSSGSGLEVGAVYKPANIPLRLGLSFRSAIRTQPSYSSGLLPDENGDLIITDSSGSQKYLPNSVAFPWDVNFGFAVQLGRRPFNPPWRTITEVVERESLTHRVREIDREERRLKEIRGAKTQEEKRAIEQAFEREQKEDDRQLEDATERARRRIEAGLAVMNRFYVQISASMLVSGPVADAVGVESLVTQVVNRSGMYTVLSPRVGVESGVIPESLRVRLGSYIEPTRFEGSEARVHGTAGLDIKLIRWNVFGAWPDDYMWRLGLGLDVARQYQTWGFTIGGWYPRHAKASELAEPQHP